MTINNNATYANPLIKPHDQELTHSMVKFSEQFEQRDDIIHKIIESHLNNQNSDRNNGFYWRNRLVSTKDDAAKEIFNPIPNDKTNGNSITKSSVLKVAQYIVTTIISDTKTTSEDDPALNKHLFYESKKDNQYINSTNKSHKSNLLAEMNSPEVIEIINIASSVLAEADGHVALAQHMLKTTGLEKLKNMDATALSNAASIFKELSASPPNQNTDGHTR